MTIEQKASRLDAIIALIRSGMAIVLFSEKDAIMIGALNFTPEADDWYYTPSQIEALTERDLSVESLEAMKTSS